MSKIKVSKVSAFSGHKQAIYALATDVNSRFIYTAGADTTVVEWNLDRPEEAKALLQLTGACYSLYFDSRGILAVTENQVGFRLYDTRKKQLIRSVSLPKSMYFDVLIIENTIYIADATGTLHFGPAMDEGTFFTLKLSDSSIRSITTNKNRSLLLCSLSDGSLKIIDRKSMQIITNINAHTKSVFRSVFLKDESWIISCGKDALIKTWKNQPPYPLGGSIEAHLYGINYLEVSPDNVHFLTCSMDKTIKIWNTLEGKLLKVIDYDRYGGHKSSINKVNWISNTEFVSIGDDRMLFSWKIDYN